MLGNNNELLVYFLHEGKLYFWREDDGNKVEKCCYTQSEEFMVLRNNCFIIRCDTKDKDKEPVFTLKKYSINFTSHSKEVYYEEK